MMFHYFLQDQSHILRIGYITSESLDTAKKLLERASIRRLIEIHAVEGRDAPGGARYMYPFEGTWSGEKIRGTVEGETLLSALQHLHGIFEGEIEYIAERPPQNANERALFTKQTEAFIATFQPPAVQEEKPVMQEVSVSASAVATVLDRQLNELFEEITKRTKELLRERQYADEIREMHSIMFSAQKRKDLDLKEKYDTLSYVLRELSYVEDGLDHSPVKKDMRVLIDDVVNLLKKVEKSMVRTAFHLDNARMSLGEDEDMSLDVEAPTKIEQALSRYASRKQLVARVMLGIQQLKVGNVALSTAGSSISMPASDNLFSQEDAAGESSLRQEIQPSNHEQIPSSRKSSHHAHAAEPLHHIFLREIPLFLEWFTGFSIIIIIAGQVASAMPSAPIIAGYNLAEMLAPFALQSVFLKTVFLALITLIGLRGYKMFDHRPILQWLSSIFVLITAVLLFFVT